MHSFDQKIIGHVCNGGEIKGIIREYPSIFCSLCRERFADSDVHMTLQEINDHNAALKKGLPMESKKRYFGITYPTLLSYNTILNLWKRFLCKRNIHLFDEVLSGDDHHLVCDACGLMVHITKINWKYVDKETLDAMNETDE